MNKITKIYKEIIKNKLLDDRAEYDKDDLKSAYELSDKEAKELYSKLQRAKYSNENK